MKKTFVMFLISCICAVPVFAEGVLTAHVIKVSDGDTVTVLLEDGSRKRIRLAQIDAPEKGQPWGNQSRNALARLVDAKDVTLQVRDTDRYGRLVADIVVDGVNVNHKMVENGHAWVYRQYAKDGSIYAAEQSARKTNSGLWALPANDRTAPWQWRKEKRESRKKH